MQAKGKTKQRSGDGRLHGWALFLCVQLTLLVPAATLLRLAYLYGGLPVDLGLNELDPLATLAFDDTVLSVALAAVSCVAGLRLWRRTPDAVWLTKLALGLSIAYSALSAPHVFRLQWLTTGDGFGWGPPALVWLMSLLWSVLLLAYVVRSTTLHTTLGLQSSAGLVRARERLAAERRFSNLFPGGSPRLQFYVGGAVLAGLLASWLIRDIFMRLHFWQFQQRFEEAVIVVDGGPAVHAGIFGQFLITAMCFALLLRFSRHPIVFVVGMAATSLVAGAAMRAGFPPLYSSEHWVAFALVSGALLALTLIVPLRLYGATRLTLMVGGALAFTGIGMANALLFPFQLDPLWLAGGVAAGIAFGACLYVGLLLQSATGNQPTQPATIEHAPSVSNVEQSQPQVQTPPPLAAEPDPPPATPVAPTPVAPTPVASTPVAPTPVAPTPVAPTPVAPTPVAPTPVPPAVRDGNYTVGDQETRVEDVRVEGLGPGSIVANRYEVRSLLGRGGMGVVYRVQDRVLESPCALKLMHPHLLTQERAMRRFVEEARISLDLQHANIIRVRDIGQWGELRYLTMELLEGRSLRSWLQELTAAKQLAPVAVVRSIGNQVLDALEYSHGRSTVHRDIKPENIFMVGSAPDYHVKLLDFGIAKAMDQEALTTTNISLGTAWYMAPEQRVPEADVDARADLYSVGVVLYEVLTGGLPSFRVQSPSKKRNDLDATWDDLILSAMEEDPADRPQTAAEMAARLRQL